MGINIIAELPIYILNSSPMLHPSFPRNLWLTFNIAPSRTHEGDSMNCPISTRMSKEPIFHRIKSDSERPVITPAKERSSNDGYCYVMCRLEVLQYWLEWLMHPIFIGLGVMPWALGRNSFFEYRFILFCQVGDVLCVAHDTRAVRALSSIIGFH